MATACSSFFSRSQGCRRCDLLGAGARGWRHGGMGAEEASTRAVRRPLLWGWRQRRRDGRRATRAGVGCLQRIRRGARGRAVYDEMRRTSGGRSRMRITAKSMGKRRVKPCISDLKFLQIVVSYGGMQAMKKGPTTHEGSRVSDGPSRRESAQWAESPRASTASLSLTAYETRPTRPGEKDEAESVVRFEPCLVVLTGAIRFDPDLQLRQRLKTAQDFLNFSRGSTQDLLIQEATTE
ncbi:hypothetical protein C8R44DRAFT_752588 [Mycena epipterygia]|nr:hypothetical protein C8R44DRAFT_752588 [Mycena epipterygia]